MKSYLIDVIEKDRVVNCFKPEFDNFEDLKDFCLGLLEINPDLTLVMAYQCSAFRYEESSDPLVLKECFSFGCFKRKEGITLSEDFNLITNYYYFAKERK